MGDLEGLGGVQASAPPSARSITAPDFAIVACMTLSWLRLPGQRCLNDFELAAHTWRGPYSAFWKAVWEPEGTQSEPILGRWAGACLAKLRQVQQIICGKDVLVSAQKLQARSLSLQERKPRRLPNQDERRSICKHCFSNPAQGQLNTATSSFISKPFD